MATIEQKWLKKYAQAGRYHVEFTKFLKTEKKSITKFILQCRDCEWESRSTSAFEPEVHSYLTGHTIIRTTITEFSRCKE